ncbi:hypothetical protein SDC9_166967 [bioreactor metagenome]|uniref:Uncharacterized protein n=1 Tax=bioreactor metagenome TaxID=1076179 RepID=A0A645FYU1_9ZZZZ
MVVQPHAGGPAAHEQRDLGTGPAQVVEERRYRVPREGDTRMQLGEEALLVGILQLAVLYPAEADPEHGDAPDLECVVAVVDLAKLVEHVAEKLLRKHDVGPILEVHRRCRDGAACLLLQGDVPAADDVSDGGPVDRKPPVPVAAAADPCPDGIPVAVLSVCDDDGILRPLDGQDLFWNRHEDPLFFIV